MEVTWLCKLILPIQRLSKESVDLLPSLSTVVSLALLEKNSSYKANTLACQTVMASLPADLFRLLNLTIVEYTLKWSMLGNYPTFLGDTVDSLQEQDALMMSRMFMRVRCTSKLELKILIHREMQL
jgi:hypothetical protein